MVICEGTCEGICSEEPMYKDLMWGVHVRLHAVRSSSENPSEGPFGPGKDPLRT